jgi:hypothetical protein
MGGPVASDVLKAGEADDIGSVEVLIAGNGLDFNLELGLAAGFEELGFQRLCHFFRCVMHGGYGVARKQHNVNTRK